MERSAENVLIETMGLDKLTDEEAEYLARLLPKVNYGILKNGQISIKRARELFDKKFPNNNWR